jgi:hypothetical protein
MPDLSGPAAALNSTSSKAKYDYRLSWLPGQRLRYVFFIFLS